MVWELDSCSGCDSVFAQVSGSMPSCAKCMQMPRDRESSQRNREEGCNTESSIESASNKWGYGLVAYGMVICQSPKIIFQRPKFAGKSPKFRRKNDFCQISGSEF